MKKDTKPEQTKYGILSNARTFKDEKEKEIYSKIQEISKKKTESGIEDKNVFFKVPVSNNKFYSYYTADISTEKYDALLYVISDNTRLDNSVLQVSHIIDASVASPNYNKSMNVGDKLFVIVLNDYPDDFENYQADIIKAFQVYVKAHGANCISRRNLDKFLENFRRTQPKGELIPQFASGGIIVR